MRLFHFLILKLLFFTASGQVTGRLIDALTEVPVENALIISGKEAAFSDSEGVFRITVSEFLIVEAAGYQRLQIKADTSRRMLIRLNPLSYDLSEVNIIAFHTPGKLRSVAGAVSVIPVRPYQANDYNIVSSLSASPGVFIQEATPGTMKLTLRGIGSRYPYGTRKIKMYFDEIPLYSAEVETMFDDISSGYLNRMEVLRGPASSIYGASLGGAVILYPKRSEYGVSKFQLSNSAGSFGYRKHSAAFSGGNNTNDLLVSVNRIVSDGYRENSEYNRNSLMVNYNHIYSDKLSGTLLLLGSSVQAQIPSSLDSLTFFTDPRRAASNWLQTKGNKTPVRILSGYRLKYRPSKNWDISGSLFGTYRKNEENRPFNFLNEDGVSYGTRLLARYTRDVRQIRYTLTAGSNLFFETYNSSISENPGGLGVKGNLQQKGSQFLYQSDLFLQTEIQISDFRMTGGLDFNKSGFIFNDLFSSDTLDQSGYYHFHPVFSPRLSLNWNPLRQVNFYIALNHGFTIPSLTDTQTPLGLINRDIKPEKAWSYESGMRADLFNSLTFIDIAYYYMKVSDLIVPKRVEEDFYVGMNAGASLHRGIEISWQQWLWGKSENAENSPFSAVMNLNYSLNSFKFLDFIEDENDFSGNQLPGMPENYFNGSIDFNAKMGIYSRMEIISSGKIPFDDFNSRFTSKWLIFNAGIGYLLKVKHKWEFDILFKMNNLSNTHYASMIVVNAPGTANRPPRYYYPGMPRWFSFNLGMGYILKRK